MNFDVSHYKQSFFLEENNGNNGFGFERRSESNPSPAIRVAALQEYANTQAALSDISLTTSIAFELEIEGIIKSFNGLKNFLIFPNPHRPDRPIIVFDNHNHAFYFWHWAAKYFNLTTPLTLLHIDQHKDSRLPIEMLSPQDSKDLEKVFQYTNQVLNVGNFVPPAIKTGLIDKVQTIDSSTAVSAFELPDQPFILDLDLDFFAPEFDYIDRHQKILLIQKSLPSAEIVTIATSPFFIEQPTAVKALQEIFSTGS